MKSINYLLGSVLFGVLILALVSFNLPSDVQDDWEVPAKYKTMKNPQKDKKDSDLIGKGLFTKHCQSCHGKKGLGDGTKAAMLETEIESFATTEFQKQTDGEIYYKSIIGRDEMPNFEKKIASEEDRWLLVNYLRTLK